MAPCLAGLASCSGATGDIINTLLENKFRIVGMKMLHINKHQAEGFYAVHVHRPFFESLTNFMSSGPIMVIALEKEDAIAEDLVAFDHGSIQGRASGGTVTVIVARLVSESPPVRTAQLRAPRIQPGRPAGRSPAGIGLRSAAVKSSPYGTPVGGWSGFGIAAVTAGIAAFQFCNSRLVASAFVI